MKSSINNNKWIFINKKDEFGVDTRNKAQFIAQYFNQEEWRDYDEIYALVARLETTWTLYVYACYKYFKYFQMNVKSTLLNDFIIEYAKKRPGFKNDILSKSYF